MQHPSDEDAPIDVKELQRLVELLSRRDPEHATRMLVRALHALRERQSAGKPAGERILVPLFSSGVSLRLTADEIVHVLGELEARSEPEPRGSDFAIDVEWCTPESPTERFEVFPELLFPQPQVSREAPASAKKAPKRRGWMRLGLAAVVAAVALLGAIAVANRGHARRGAESGLEVGR